MTQTALATETSRAVPLEYVDASLTYLIPSAGKPVFDYRKPREEEERIRSNFASYPVEVSNGRWRQESFSLDEEGFELAHHATALDDFSDDAAVKEVYYPEMERLLKRETGAAHVVVFDHNVRIDTGTLDLKPGAKQPVRRIHNDYTAKSGPQRVEDLLTPGELAEQAGRDVAVINVWRPIRGPVQTAPLALADARSVPAQDFVAADLVYPDRTGEIYYAHWNPMHRWVYFPNMGSDEALLIKGYDSRDDGRARFTLHTAFDDPTTPDVAEPRHSIEVRTLAFFD